MTSPDVLLNGAQRRFAFQLSTELTRAKIELGAAQRELQSKRTTLLEREVEFSRIANNDGARRWAIPLVPVTIAAAAMDTVAFLEVASTLAPTNTPFWFVYAASLLLAIGFVSVDLIFGAPTPTLAARKLGLRLLGQAGLAVTLLAPPLVAGTVLALRTASVNVLSPPILLLMAVMVVMMPLFHAGIVRAAHFDAPEYLVRIVRRWFSRRAVSKAEQFVAECAGVASRALIELELAADPTSTLARDACSKSDSASFMAQDTPANQAGADTGKVGEDLNVPVNS